MSVSQHDWSLHRKGQIDQERHKEKIREAVKKNLGDIVSEESIILSDAKKLYASPFAPSTSTASATIPVANNMQARVMAKVKSAMSSLKNHVPVKAKKVRPVKKLATTTMKPKLPWTNWLP